MTDYEIDIREIKETLSKIQAQIDIFETKLNTINPQCFWLTTTAANPNCFTPPNYSLEDRLSLTAARNLWPMLEKEFDEYCTNNKITVWTPTNSLDFYNKYIGLGADFPETFNDVQNGNYETYTRSVSA